MPRSILSLMLAVLLLEIGSGLQGVLIPIRGELAGFSTKMIGGLGTVYYLGFVAGCMLLPGTVRRVGHIRCYSALAAITSSIALLQAMLVVPAAWIVLRAAMGFCFAGLFMVTESWLNDQTTNATRGRVLGLYMIATWLGVIVGKMLFATMLPEGFDMFAVVSIAVGLSLVPIALTDGAVPSIPQPSRIGLRALYAMAPVGLVGCIAVGVANGAFWSFAPLFAKDRVGPGIGVSLFMAACVLGGAVTQWPAGRLSDLVDRRRVIVVLCAASAVTGVALAWGPLASDAATLIAAALFGASSLTIYSICVAYANDRANPESFVDVSSHLLLAFGLGAIAGPFAAGLLISATDIASLFVFTAAIEAAFAVFVLTRMRATLPVPEAERAIFVAQPPLSHGTQAIIDLQPAVEAK